MLLWAFSQGTAASTPFPENERKAMSTVELYPSFEAKEHAKDTFRQVLAIKNIAMCLAVSVLGGILFKFFPFVHNRSGRYLMLASLVMMAGGVVVAFIMRHDFLHQKTGEKLTMWFRYFNPEQKDILMDIFQREDWAALKGLEYALDEGESGNSDASGTSSLQIQVDGVESGEYLAVQVIEYIRHAPEGVSPIKFFEGAQGKAIVQIFKDVNQGT
jgi:hypothetical protein